MPTNTPTQEDIRIGREWVADAAHEWACDLKRPYHAAGLDLDAALKHVGTREDKASGSTAHPWPPELKFEMVRGINGAYDMPEVNRRIEKLQMDYEAVLRGELDLDTPLGRISDAPDPDGDDDAGEFGDDDV